MARVSYVDWGDICQEDLIWVFTLLPRVESECSLREPGYLDQLEMCSRGLSLR